jgi:type IV pilus assembly protein PilQ
MISFTALWLSALLFAAEIQTLSVVPSANRTDVVINLTGDVTVSHSFSSDSNRLILDLTGAQQTVKLEFSDIDRGGVRSLRVAQLNTDVVRVVVDLVQAVEYDVSVRAGEVRASFPNPGASFEPWSMSLHGGSQRPQEAPLSFAFVDQPIVDVLAVFSEVSGRSIVAAPDVVSRMINAEIRDKPWDLALASILNAYGMVVTENEGGILTVESHETVKRRLENEPLLTQEYRINFMSADSLIETVKSLLTPNGKVAVNSAGNSLLVTDNRTTIQRIAPIIRQLDVRQPQVSIAAKIVFVDRSALEELGFVYDLKDTRGHALNPVIPGASDAMGATLPQPAKQAENNMVLLGGNSVNALANANYRVTSAALQVLTSLVLGRHSLFTFIEALQQVSVSDVQAAPVVTTIANREARIQVGERTPVRTIDAGAGGLTSGAAPRATVRLEQTGIILRVTPTITGNQVMLEIHAERSNIGLAPADIGATFNTQEADTQVLVENGETAVIGGLTLIEKLKVRAGIPILMNIPLLGRLFRQESTRENKRDLLIMVTPHIIREGQQ